MSQSVKWSFVAVLVALSACSSGSSDGEVFIVTASGTHVTVSPDGSVRVNKDATQSFTVTPEANFQTQSTVTGSCPPGSWSGTVYTTGPITADCAVGFSATAQFFSVSSSGAHATVSPAGVQSVAAGTAQAFTVTPDDHYTVSATTGGNCPSGTWNGNVYTTGAIAADCEVSFSATLATYRVTASGDAQTTLLPSAPQAVDYGLTQSFTVTAGDGWILSTSVGGDCPAGSWSGNVYTTGPITSDCDVSFSATLNSYQVTVSGSNVTVAPETAQTVSAGSTSSFTVTADAYHTLSQSVGGSCPAGTWNGNVYTTGAIAADCEVSFSATLATYRVTASGDAQTTLLPSAPQAVDYGLTQSFTVTATDAYTVSSIAGGTCPAGSWSGNVYTTGPITSDCDVSFSATLNSYQVTVSGSNVTVAPETAQTVSAGSTSSFTVTADAYHTLSQSVGGSCPAGTWNGNVYTTGAIAADCEVSFSATLATYRVTASGDAQTTLLPSAPQAVDYGLTQSFTVTAGDGWILSTSVGGDCPAGEWSGDIYTTGAITSDCSVTFATTPGFKVSVASTLSGGVIPSGLLGVAPGAAQSITVTPTVSEAVSPVVGGTCPTGTWFGNVYTTGAISADCTVRVTSVVPVLQQATWMDNTTPLGAYSRFMPATKPAGLTDTVQFSFAGDPRINVAQATATANQIALLEWTFSGDHQDTTIMVAFSDGPEGRTFSRVLNKGSALTGRASVSLRAGYAFGVMIYDQTFAREESGSLEMTTLQTAPDYHVTVVGGSVAGATVPFGATPGFTAAEGSPVGGDCAPGSWNGALYTPDAVTADCTVTFDGSSPSNGSAVMPTPAPAAGGSTRGPNQAPTIALGADPFVDMYSYFYTSLGWATLSPGAASESSQQLTATLAITGTTDTLTFDSPPTLDVATGSLSFAAHPGTYGTATLLLKVKDDGGTANGGTDTATATFTISINSLALAKDLSLKNTWRSPCIPITYIGVDVRTNDDALFELVTLPQNGYVSQVPARSMPRSANSYTFPTDGAGTYSNAICYIPFVSTFTGFDSFAYSLRDNNGGPPSRGIVSIQIIEY